MIIIAEKRINISNEKLEGSNEKVFIDNYVLEGTDVKSKFSNDRCFVINKDFLILFHGVLLNSKKLFAKYCVNSIYDLLESCYRRHANVFWNEFRGNFYGILYDIKKKEMFAFTDHLSNKTLFYYDDKERIILSDNVSDIASYCREKGKLKLCRGGAYAMLTYAYMYHDLTLFENIKRLLPGWYMVIKNNKIERIQYYQISHGCNKEKSMERAISDIDALFLNAVSMQIEKNREYDYYNYAPLSAGLDSRISTMALNRLHAQNIINFTYSQSGELDQKVPMKITEDLGNQWIFKNLDNGWDLLDIDEAIKLGDTLIYYAWPAQLQSFFRMIDTRKMGVVHTGVIGDIVIGSYLGRNSNKLEDYRVGDGAYSKKLLYKLADSIKPISYENYEIGMIYNRAINGVCLGYSTTFDKYTEACSPFMDIDLLSYCLTLPLEYRIQHKIYYRWVEKCYPEAMKYKHNGLKMSTSNLGIRLTGKYIAFDTVPSRIWLMIKSKISKKNGMNPLDFWFDSNKILRDYMNKYFASKLELKYLDEEIYQDAKWLYDTGNTIEKIMAISLVGSISHFFK